MISPLAYIHPEAKIGENVEIAPFVFIDKNVVIGDNNKIMANANILYGARIGNGNTIFPGAVIGAIPQDLKFRGEESKNNFFRYEGLKLYLFWGGMVCNILVFLMLASSMFGR